MNKDAKRTWDIIKGNMNCFNCKYKNTIEIHDTDYTDYMCVQDILFPAKNMIDNCRHWE